MFIIPMIKPSAIYFMKRLYLTAVNISGFWLWNHKHTTNVDNRKQSLDFPNWNIKTRFSTAVKDKFSTKTPCVFYLSKFSMTEMNMKISELKCNFFFIYCSNILLHLQSCSCLFFSALLFATVWQPNNKCITLL